MDPEWLWPECERQHIGCRSFLFHIAGDDVIEKDSLSVVRHYYKVEMSVEKLSFDVNSNFEWTF